MQWRTAGITALGELSQPTRLTGTAVRVVTHAFLVTFLWRALYTDTSTTAGLTRDQAVTYAVLAVLAVQIRGHERRVARDSLLQHVQHGTVLYWFLRPLQPRRYYLIRGVGDLAYGLIWVGVGYVICVVVGAVRLPAGSVPAFLVSMACAQVIVYQLLLLVDLLCFWTLQNEAGLSILRFLQNLLAGVIAPLWFFPDWFLILGWILPFRYTLDVPLSLYVGRLGSAEAPYLIAAQVMWIGVLVLLTRLLWRRATARVTFQGG